MAQRICSIAGCEKASRKRTWCNTHYSRWRRNGSPLDEHQKWTVDPPGAPCMVCGAPVRTGSGFRRYCGRSCAVIWHERGARPQVLPCASCGEPFSLTERSQSGRLRYASKSVCDKCATRKSLRRHVEGLASRDGWDCSLCAEPIDPSLRHPHPASVSVDHVVPRSLGGADHEDNYALAHLACNMRKSNRLI